MPTPLSSLAATLKRLLGHRRFVVAGIALIFLALGYLLLAQQSSKDFGAAYVTYAALAKAQEQAAYLPAAPNNPVRQQLNLVLAETLQPGVAPLRRLKDAQTGLGLLAELDAQIDAIGSTSEAANVVLAKMQVNFSNGLTTTETMHELIDLAKQRSSIIEDIRGLSYRADFDTRKIFERIIADKGVLTEAHVTDLNNEVPEVETEFDKRTSLYTQLGSVSATIDKTAATLGPDFVPAATPG